MRECIPGLVVDTAVCVVAGGSAGVFASDDDSVAADIKCSAIGSSTVCIDLDTVYFMFANFLAHFVQKAGLTNDGGINLFPAICARVDLKRATNSMSRYSSAFLDTRCL